MMAVIRSNSGYLATIKSSPTVLKQETGEIGFSVAVVKKNLNIFLAEESTNKISSFSPQLLPQISVLLPSILYIDRNQSTIPLRGPAKCRGN